MKKILLIAIIFSGVKIFAQCPITYSLTSLPESCVGCCDGSITVSSINNGCGAYLITLNPGNMVNGTGIFQNLCGGNTYTISVQDAGCCSILTFTSCVDFAGCGSTGIDALAANDNLAVWLYPNPSSGNITISTFVLKEAEIKITDIAGKLIYSKNLSLTNGVDMLEIELKDGIYLVSVVNMKTRQQAVKKLVIQK